MNKNEVKHTIINFVENADEESLRQMLDLISDFSECTKHGKGQICDEAARIKSEDINEAILVTFPPKYCGENEDLIEEIAQRDREENLIKNVLEALKLEKTRGC